MPNPQASPESGRRGVCLGFKFPYQSGFADQVVGILALKFPTRAGLPTRWLVMVTTPPLPGRGLLEEEGGCRRGFSEGAEAGQLRRQRSVPAGEAHDPRQVGRGEGRASSPGRRQGAPQGHQRGPHQGEIGAEVAVARARLAGSTLEEQDGMLKEWTSLGLSRNQVTHKVGNFRYDRIRDGKPKQLRGGRKDVTKLTPETISYVKHIVKDDAESSKVHVGHKLEPGLPCQHKPTNWCLCDGATLKEVHAAMVAGLEADPAEGVRAPSRGNFDIIFGPFPARRQHRSTPPCPCAAVSLLHVLIGDWLVLGIRHCDQFGISGAPTSPGRSSTTTCT